MQDSYPQNVIDAAASNVPKVQRAFNTDSALALITQAGLSKYQYEILRKATTDIGYNIFPSYKEIADSKKKCYPDDIIVTETMAKVGLQELLDHSAKRILETKTENEIKNLKQDNFTFIYKVGL